MVKVRMIVPANVRHRSGGNIYNARLVESLRAQGAEVAVHSLDGGWPSGTATDKSHLAAALAGDNLSICIVDGLIATGAPTEIETATAAGRRVWVLLHMPVSGELDLEMRALRAATGLLCTGSGTAEAAKRCGLPNVHAATAGADRPGKRAIPRGPGGKPGPSGASEAPHFIMVGALLPNKDQILFVEALARIKDLAWTAAIVGSTTADPSYASAVRERIFRHGLEKRVELRGEHSGPALEEQWLRADLSLLVSHSESFGMVVQESLAYGIPVVVRKGTGAVEALGAHGAGEAIDLAPGTGSLAEMLQRWLSDSALRKRWQDAAAAASQVLPRWEETACEVLRIVAGTRH
ncbi:glycosyltransferase [Arthrobacter sp. MMS18-M83]|uniref:glycosyltransferase n=1 Tax=Arthrobacter sp. MMS18-M83 TaxID=2996261 RepID=UPI00227BC89A|nr:glycosyltransferase [Arthrobacter sp. MMS18-M83]WAH97181.1 glycosyltransferase [Arthrobacter sp. MMS18-M83]